MYYSSEVNYYIPVHYSDTCSLEECHSYGELSSRLALYAVGRRAGPGAAHPACSSPVNSANHGLGYGLCDGSSDRSIMGWTQ